MNGFNIVISYDLNGKDKNYEELYKQIESLGLAKRILKSVWFSRTELSSEDVFNKLAPLIDEDDEIFVCEISNWSARLGEEEGEFVLNHFVFPLIGQ